MVMERIPVVASVTDLPGAIDYAERVESSRWYIMRRATVLKAFDKIPKHWYGDAEPVTAALVASADGPALTSTDLVDSVRTSLLDYTSGVTEMDALTASIGEVVWAGHSTKLPYTSEIIELVQGFTAAGRLETSEQDEIFEALTAAARYVRTPEGAQFYGQPIGSVIVPNVYLPIGSRKIQDLKSGDFYTEPDDGVKIRLTEDAYQTSGRTVVKGVDEDGDEVEKQYWMPGNVPTSGDQNVPTDNKVVKIFKSAPKGAKATLGDTDAAKARLTQAASDFAARENAAGRKVDHSLTSEEDEALKTGEVPELKPAPASTAFVDNASRSLGTINPGAKGNDPERFTPKETFADGTTPAAGQKIRDKKGRTGTVQETYQAYTAVRWDDTSKVQTVKNDRLNATGGAAPSIASTDAAGKAGETTKKAIDNSPTTDTGGAAELPDSKPTVDPLSKVKRVKADPIDSGWITDRVGSNAPNSYRIEGADGSTIGFIQRGYDQSDILNGRIRVGRHIDRRGWLAYDKDGRLLDQTGKKTGYTGYLAHPDQNAAMDTVKQRFSADAPKVTPPVPAPAAFDVNSIKQGDTVRVNLNEEIRQGSRTLSQDMLVVNPNGGDKVQLARPNGSNTWVSRSEIVGMGTGAPAEQGDLVPRVYDPVYPSGRPMPTSAGPVDTGDIVLMSTYDGDNQYILVEEVSDDIKNGQAGFSGRSVNVDGSPNYDKNDKWGYADQIIRVQSKGAAKPAIADNTVDVVPGAAAGLGPQDARLLNLMLRPRAKTAGRAALLKRTTLEDLQSRYRSAYNSMLHTQDDYNAWASIVNALRKEIIARGAEPNADDIRYTGQN